MEYFQTRSAGENRGMEEREYTFFFISFDDLLFPFFTTCSYVGWLRRDRQLCRSPAAAELVCVCVYCASSSLHTHPRLLWRRLGFFSSFRGLERRGNSCAAAAAVSRTGCISGFEMWRWLSSSTAWVGGGSKLASSLIWREKSAHALKNLDLLLLA